MQASSTVYAEAFVLFLRGALLFLRSCVLMYFFSMMSR
jgi:hypothetical protein